MKKRILPALLALCMVMSLLPVAFATDPEPEKVSCSAVPATGTVLETKTVKVTVTEEQESKEVDCTVTVKVGDVAAKTAHVGETCGASNCTCYTKGQVQEGQATKGEDGKYTRTDTVAYTFSLCDACKANKTCNPCGFGGEGGKCTEIKGHTGAHNNTVCPGSGDSDDNPCGAKAGTHKNGCSLYEACGKVGEDADNGDAAINCTLDKGHSGNHNNGTCIETAQCGATTHKEGCPNICGINGCTKLKGHKDAHTFTEDTCLGYTADERCAATKHIAGCPKYDCKCASGHASGDITYGQYTGDKVIKGFTGDKTTCTKKAGCALCNSWNSYVTGVNSKLLAEYNKLVGEAETDADKAAVEKPTYLLPCTCKDCKPNPAMGAVTDENGNPVDPTDPTDPAEPEAPKAEDFTDMEEWMAADVQVALDKGWLQGEGETFNGRGVTTGTTIAAVLARMDGETITGADWDKDALAWAEGKDVFEGVELTGESMARKDLVLVIWRLADKPESDKALDDFTDVDGLEGDHLTAMKWAVENGIVKGNGDGTITPDGSVTRAALCAMLARYDSLEK